MAERMYRKPGELLTLGDIIYHLESVEGCGGSAVVYRAWYEDSLNLNQRHKVLIKELFPDRMHGIIWRDETGNVCCNDEGQTLMENYRKNFYLGNQMNLELLEEMPEEISGNLNSYEAYGTYYTVLPIHGGETLNRLLEKEIKLDLRQCVQLLRQILRALQRFHKYGLLHLDISPDNILVLSHNVLLIDYNSVWALEKREQEEFSYSVKTGYTAPEVIRKEEKSIGYATDIYSVCAVFFWMVTGQKLTWEDVQKNQIIKHLTRELPVFKNAPVTAAAKAIQIILKGLYLLPRKRYQSTEEMDEQLQEVLNRIDGKGITHSALWESSVKIRTHRKRMEEKYLERLIRTAEGDILETKTCQEFLIHGGLLLLKGPGGMGKTQFLIKLWEYGIRQYHAAMPVMLYIPLADYQEAAEGETHFIRKSILRPLQFEPATDSMETALHELEHLLRHPLEKDRRPPVVLLLDGLNEAGYNRIGLLQEIEKLREQFHLGIIVTDRSDAVLQYGLQEFSAAELLPLTGEVVRQELTASDIAVPEDKELQKLLQNPMMLSLYRKTSKIYQISGMSDGEIKDTEELIRQYLEAIRVQYLRIYDGNEREQLRHDYLLQHVLPMAAREMERKEKTLLSYKELTAVTDKSYQILRKRYFSRTFASFRGASKEILEGISNRDEWFTYAVKELTERLNLLEISSENSNYRIIHDNFIHVLAKQGKENRRQIIRSNRTVWILQGGCAATALAVLTGGLAAGVCRLQEAGILPDKKKEIQLSQEEQREMDDAVQRLGIKASTLARELSVQWSVLETASELSEKLAKKEEALLEAGQDIVIGEELTEVVDMKLSSIDSMMLANGSAEISKDCLAVLEKAEIPVETYENLCKKPEEHYEESELLLKNLERKLNDASLNMLEPQRKQLIETYENYLEALEDEMYYELDLVFYHLGEKWQQELLEIYQEMDCFEDKELPSSLAVDKTVTEEEVIYNLERAKRAVSKARQEAAMKNLFKEKEGWY